MSNKISYIYIPCNYYCIYMYKILDIYYVRFKLEFIYLFSYTLYGMIKLRHVAKSIILL